MPEATTVSDVIKAAGGREDVARLCNVTVHAVDRWSTLGIPRKYWEMIIAASKDAVTLNSIFHADKTARFRTDETQ